MNRLPLLVLVLLSTALHATPSESQVNDAAKAILPKVIEWRRHIHQHPELSNREFETAKFIAENLRSFGLEVRTGAAKTGVIGILKGARPGPVIGLRADMDALPVTERNKLPFVSKVTTNYEGKQVGVMHACGHDAHVAMLLGAATVLSKMKDNIQGTIVFIFQPAEEGAPTGEEGGAELMVKEGLLANLKIEAMFGAHIFSGVASGTLQYRPGAAFASSDTFSITILGKQTHGARPWGGVDPIVTAAQVISSIQTIVSRQTDIVKSPVVITIGQINAGVRDNIIPETLTMSGTIRTLDAEIQKQVHAKIKLTAEKIAESMGAKAEVKISNGNPVTFNNPELVRKMLPSLQKAVGRDNVKETEWVTGAEDFAFFAEQVPSFYFVVGGMPKGQDPAKAPAHHTPDFYIDESRLDAGVMAFVNIALDYTTASTK